LAELAGALSAPLVEAKELRANLIRTGWVRFSPTNPTGIQRVIRSEPAGKRDEDLERCLPPRDDLRLTRAP
jgi:hypothetical protein